MQPSPGRRELEQESRPEMLTASLEIAVAGRKVALQVDVPAAPVSPRRILPLVHGLTDVAVQASVDAQSAPVSCTKGCGACCRQLVPISVVEARAIHALVGEMEEPRRSAVVAGFADACRRTEAAGLGDDLRDFSRLRSIPEMNAFGMAYFRLGIPCPFLEDESCSIHLARPAICREYLVTSDARHCADPKFDNIERIELGARVSRALSALEGRSDMPAMPWLPLIHALAWVEAHPHETESPGPQILQTLFSALARKDLPLPPGLGGDAA